MSDLWAFLADPANKATLAWLGSGIIVLAGGAWTVVKFFAGREGGKQPAPAPVSTVHADRGGFAGGRDVSVRTSHGFSGVTVVLLVLVVIGAVLLAGSLFGARITATDGVAAGRDAIGNTVVNGGTKP